MHTKNMRGKIQGATLPTVSDVAHFTHIYNGIIQGIGLSAELTPTRHAVPRAETCFSVLT